MRCKRTPWKPNSAEQTDGKRTAVAPGISKRKMRIYGKRNWNGYVWSVTHNPNLCPKFNVIVSIPADQRTVSLFAKELILWSSQGTTKSSWLPLCHERYYLSFVHSYFISYCLVPHMIICCLSSWYLRHDLLQISRPHHLLSFTIRPSLM